MNNPYVLPPGVHCDDVAESPEAPEALRGFIRYQRLPASCKLPPTTTNLQLAHHLERVPDPLKPYVTRQTPPVCYATLDLATTPTRVRLVMASRLGDVGVTIDLQAQDPSYRYRVPLDALRDFSDQP